MSTPSSSSTFLTLVLPFLLALASYNPVNSTSTSTSTSIAIAASTSSTPSVVSLPIHKSTINKRGRTGEELKTWANNQRNHLRNKYNFNPKNQKRDSGSGGASLTSYQGDSTYYTAITIGSNSQSFNVILDTGSSDLWIAAADFGTEASTSFKNLTTGFSVTYGSGSVSGYLASDSVTLASQTFPTQTFALATQVASGLTDKTLSGIMGMAFQSLASSNAIPFWQNVDLKEEIFAFYLSRDSSTVSVESGSGQGGPAGPEGIPRRREDGMQRQKKRQVVVDQGQQPSNNSQSSYQTSPFTPTSLGQFTLGGLNESLYTGDINYSEVLSKSYWLISLLDLSINGTSIDLDNTSKAAIDTGTTLIGGPSSAVKALYAKIEGSSEIPTAAGYYQYPCSTEVEIALTFGNKSYSMKEDFLASYIDTKMEYCMGAIFDVGSAESDTLQWIIGDAFLKNVYSVYSNVGGTARVGFASLAEGLDSVTQSTTSSIRSQTSDSSSLFTNVRFGVVIGVVMSTVVLFAC